MALTTTEFADAMKTRYLDPINDQVYRASAFLSEVEKNSEDVDGNFAYVSLITGRNAGVGSRKDTATSGPLLPDPGRQTYDNLTFKMALHYGRGSISGPVMRASKTNAGAFAKALDLEMKGLMKSLPEDLNRQVWGYGNGRAGTISLNGSTAIVEVYSNSIFKAKIGNRVHVATIATGTIIGPAAGTTISAIDFNTDAAGAASSIKHRVTLTASVGASFTTATDTLYFGARAAMTTEDSSRAQEMYGIPSLIDDGAIGADEDVVANAGEMLDGSLTIGGLDRTVGANAIMRAQVLQNPDGAGTNRTLTTALMEQAWLTAINIGGADPSRLRIWTNPGLWATFGLLQVGQRIYNDYKKTFETGFTGIQFNESIMYPDRDAPQNVIWFLDMENIFLLTQSGYELMDEDGNVLRRVTDRDAYEFTLYRDCQLGGRRFNTSVKLDDLITSMDIQAKI